MSTSQKIPPLEDMSKHIFMDGDTLRIFDRRGLPANANFVSCVNHEDVAKAIEDMVVQGASTIAYAAAYGLTLAVKTASQKRPDEMISYLESCGQRLKMTRITGEKLARLLDREIETAKRALESGEDLFEALIQFTKLEIERGREIAERCGRNGSQLLKGGDRLLTHCYPGSAFIYILKEALRQGKDLRIISTETRPYLQGARLTTLAARQVGVPVTLITDGMPAYCMQQGMVNKILVAADRIAMDGSIANKVGTRLYAISARYHKLPFYVLGYGGPDPNTGTGADIPIELRNGSEVTTFENRRIVVDGVDGFYPAFDVTPPELIDAIITDAKIVYPPFSKEFSDVFGKSPSEQH